jgi:hypothetical protein
MPGWKRLGAGSKKGAQNKVNALMREQALASGSLRWSTCSNHARPETGHLNKERTIIETFPVEKLQEVPIPLYQSFRNVLGSLLVLGCCDEG